MNKSLAGLIVSLGLLHGCGGYGEKSSSGFRLPDGDAAAGRQAFTDLHCNACHDVKGQDIKFEGTRKITVVLGGDVSRVKTYGELVTSIINPSHKIAPGLVPEIVAQFVSDYPSPVDRVLEFRL